MTLAIVKRNEQELADWLSTEAGFLAGLGSVEGEPLELERYQLAFLQDRSRFRWIVKARQVGYSFLFACEALARCHLRPKHTAVFISFNQDDAKEKILLARQLHEELPLAFQKRVVVDSKTELAFESSGASKGVSRILSHPSKAPRGKKGDVYLDELAHYESDREVYRGSTALILRSQGQLTGCSTPLGRRGIFWEIAAQELRTYPSHSRQEVPWWLCRFFCRDVERAARDAPQMPTEERVARFGRPAIVEQLDALPREDFEQEFECRFCDESQSYFPYELILPCTSDDVVLAGDFTDMARPTGRLVAGFDVGRTHDRSELAIFEEAGDQLTCRMLQTFDRVPFAAQEAELRRVLAELPIARLSIDRSGIGMHLAENLARDYPQVVAENFTNQSKERWVMDLKLLMQSRRIRLPRDRALVSQIHSIRRSVRASGAVSFDAERTASGHADRFWAIALACQKERGPAPRKATTIGVRVIG